MGELGLDWSAASATENASMRSGAGSGDEGVMRGIEKATPSVRIGACIGANIV